MRAASLVIDVRETTYAFGQLAELFAPILRRLAGRVVFYGLHWSNSTVMAADLLLVVGRGLWFSRGKAETETYVLELC